jgi:hypothetical protein
MIALALVCPLNVFVLRRMHVTVDEGENAWADEEDIPEEFRGNIEPENK